MIKLAVILLVAIAIFRWAFGFWPWELAKGPDIGARRLAAARRTLGVSARADRTEVLAAHRLAITRVHPDRGGSAQKVHEVDAARDVLLADLGEAVHPAASDGEVSRDDDASHDEPEVKDSTSDADR